MWSGTGLFLIWLFFLLMMSPVETSLPHARLSPQTKPAARFPMQLSTIATWAASTHTHTHKEIRTRVHKQRRRTCNASIILQHINTPLMQRCRLMVSTDENTDMKIHRADEGTSQPSCGISFKT